MSMSHIHVYEETKMLKFYEQVCNCFTWRLSSAHSFAYVCVHVTQMDCRYFSSQRSLIQQSPIETTHEERVTAKRGSVQVVPVEIGGSTRPILPKPHLIIPTERTNERERREGRRQVGIYGNTGKFSQLTLSVTKGTETVNQ